jgi:hypothetical protein
MCTANLFAFSIGSHLPTVAVVAVGAHLVRGLADGGMRLGWGNGLWHKPFPGVLPPVGGEPWPEAAIDVKGVFTRADLNILFVKILVKNELI